MFAASISSLTVSPFRAGSISMDMLPTGNRAASPPSDPRVVNLAAG